MEEKERKWKADEEELAKKNSVFARDLAHYKERKQYYKAKYRKSVPVNGASEKDKSKKDKERREKEKKERKEQRDREREQKRKEKEDRKQREKEEKEKKAADAKKQVA